MASARDLIASLDVALTRQWSRSMNLPPLQQEEAEEQQKQQLLQQQQQNQQPQAGQGKQQQHEIQLQQGKQQLQQEIQGKQQQQQLQQQVLSIDMSKLVICEVIGTGAIGKVHRGIYKDQEVAIKLLDCSKQQGGDGISDWRRLSMMKELKIWRKLDHPNIVKFIGASPGVADKNASSKVCCIVSEFMSRGTLRDYLVGPPRRGRPSIEMVLRFATDVARGLEYLHARRIVHRDVKTRNILLDASLHAKLGDFDSARVEADDLNDMSGEIGTVGYMAPEVANGMPYDRKSDVFSFGVCLLEMFCPDMLTATAGGGMVLCLSFVDLTKKSLALSSKLRNRVPKSCPPQLAEIMKKCWKKDPNKRPPMREVVSMLGGINNPGTRVLTRRSSLP